MIFLIILSNDESELAKIHWTRILSFQINQQYMMNISKFPHYWRQQTPYVIHKEQQAAANKRIRQQNNHTVK